MAQKQPAPADEVAALIADEISAGHPNTHRGFVLEMLSELGEDGKTVKFDLSRKVQEHTALADYRAHTLLDTSSLVAYANKYGDKEKSIIFVSPSGVELVLTDTVERGRREIIGVEFQPTDDWLAWGDCIGTYIRHQAMLEFLTKHTHNLLDGQILESMRSAPVNMHVKQTSEVHRDSKTLGVMVHTQSGDELKKFPTEFSIQVPVFPTDLADRSAWATLKVMLFIELPSASGEQVKFLFVAPEWKPTMQARLNREVEKIRSELDGWLVVAGTAKYHQRPSLLCHGEFDERID